MRGFAVLCASLLLLSACDDAPASDDAGRADASPEDAGEARPDSGPVDSGPLLADGGTSFYGTYAIGATFTEGGIYDSARHAFYVGSLANGSVNRIDAETGEETLMFEETAPGLWWTLGMDVDEAAGLLFVCAMEDLRDTGADPEYDGYIWVFDLATGARINNHDLSTVSADATCTDVTIADDGTAYICDRENPRIYRLATDGSLTIVADDPMLEGAVVGQNALVVLPDQSALLSIVYLPSSLLHIRLSDGLVTEVDIDGDFSDGLPPLSGADGMAWDDGSVLVEFTSQLNRVTPTLADWSRATSTTVDVPSGMTDVVMTPVGPYLLNGQAVDFALNRDPDPAQLVRFVGTL